MPGNELAAIYSRVNARLQAEHIPEVQYDVFSWRMARAIQYRTSGGCRGMPQNPTVADRLHTVNGKSGAKTADTAAAGLDKDAEQE